MADRIASSTYPKSLETYGLAPSVQRTVKTSEVTIMYSQKEIVPVTAPRHSIKETSVGTAMSHILLTRSSGTEMRVETRADTAMSSRKQQVPRTSVNVAIPTSALLETKVWRWM